MIDGSEGEGGGQMVRNSCALSLVTGQPFRITNIRAKRSKPGLMRQHVTAVEAAAAISGSECSGLTVGSSDLTFHPGKAQAGDYRFAVGTAGSTGLVLQTVLMPLLRPTARRGWYLKGARTTCWPRRSILSSAAFFPSSTRWGRASARLMRHGFYARRRADRGGDCAGAAGARRLHRRGDLLCVGAQAAYCGLAGEIPQRMLDRARKDLPGWNAEDFAIRKLPDDQGPGVILMLEARYQEVTEIVSGFGQLGVTAERLGKTAAARMRGYLESDAFAGPYLADQLILPFVLAGGGMFTTVKPSQHLVTAIDIAQRFTGRTVRLEQQEGGCHRVGVE
jgi:RNA 3'-terminal phosphate cyclase (ATP)